MEQETQRVYGLYIWKHLIYLDLTNRRQAFMNQLCIMSANVHSVQGYYHHFTILTQDDTDREML